MSQTRHQGQRHGVGNVGTNDARQRQQGVHQQQHRDTDGARAHRGERDQRADHRAQQHGQAPVAGAGDVAGVGLACGVLGGLALGRKNNRLVERGSGREQQGKAQRGGHDALGCCAGRAQGVQRPQRQQGGRNAARAQLAHHFPGHQALAGQADGAAHLGEGRKQQIGAYGHVGLDAEKEDEDRRHQRATAHASESDDQTHRETRKDKRQFMHGGECRGASYGSKLLFCASNMQI